jgi:iodotyrosine deiodinase
MKEEQRTAHAPEMRPLVFERLPAEEQIRRVRAFYEQMCRRRTVREFSAEPVPFELVEMAIRTAATAPSGANQQPWRFVVVSNLETKRKIRAAAEAEEKEFYERRAPKEWLEALAPLGTDWHKPFLETAPYLIVVFRLDYDLRRNAEGMEIRVKNYYAQESVGIAVGILLTALHIAGIATLTHTPSPMGFLGRLLERPKNERAYMLIPVGYPAEDAKVPRITKKELGEVMIVRS